MRMNSKNSYHEFKYHSNFVNQIMTHSTINYWIKTACGRAKYAELQSRQGIFARIRLIWFVIIAALRDWNLSNPDQSEGLDS